MSVPVPVPISAENGPIAFSRVTAEAAHGDVADASIVVRDAEGPERTLTGDGTFRSAPAFSPDGA